MTERLTVFLAIGNIVGPVTGVKDIVVKKGEWALLNGGRAIPTMPITSA